jgi:signal transduction histidine kinase
LIQDYLYFADLEVILVREELKKQLSENRMEGAQEVIRDIAAAVAGEFQRGGDLTCAVEESALQMAEDSLIRIVEKLLESAFQQSLPGTAVELQAGVIPGAGEYHIRVKDLGRGLSAEQVDRILGKSGNLARAYEIQGAGIGLMIVRRLVNLYGGRFSIESQPHSGKMVDVYLVTGKD